MVGNSGSEIHDYQGAELRALWFRVWVLLESVVLRAQYTKLPSMISLTQALQTYCQCRTSRADVVLNFPNLGIVG